MTVIPFGVTQIGVPFLVVAALLALVFLHRFSESGVCIQCGGRGAHRDTCPFKKDYP